MLYLSTNEETALSEIGSIQGDHVQLIAYKISPGSTIRANCIGEVEHVVRTGYLRTFGRDPEGAVLKMITDQPYEKGRTWAYVDAYLARLLADERASERGYELSRLVSKLAFRKSGASAMFYPSVRSDIGMNLAVQASAAKNSLQAVASYVVQVEKIRRFNFHDVRITRQVAGVDEGGRFRWGSELTPGQMIVFNATKEEFEAELSRNPQLAGGPSYLDR